MAQHSTGARRAPERREPQGPLEDLISSQELSVLRGVASSPRLTEDLALLLLNRRDLPPPVLEDVSRNTATMRHRKVIMAVVSHPRTPRHVTLPIARHLYTFELMQLALTPVVASDIKLAIEETLVSRLETISSGERMSLARRGSTRIAAALLTDPETRVIEAALDNPYLTEIWVVKTLMRDGCPHPLVHAVCNHKKWSLRRDVQVALLRNQETPLARAIVIAGALPIHVVRDVLHHSRLAPNIKTYLADQLQRRVQKKKARVVDPGPPTS
jgi:hypothetical protein